MHFFILAFAFLADGEPSSALKLLPVSIENGRKSADVPGKFSKTKSALKKMGLNPLKPSTPVCDVRRDENRLFYEFYNLLSTGDRSREVAIQRVKRTVTEIQANGESTDKVDFMVEAFKLQNGLMKRPDQHFGSFGSKGLAKRIIKKEFEIGFGEISGTVESEGSAWPFERNKLYKSIAEYGPSSELYSSVQFSSSLKWSLRASLASDGDYSLDVPKLGISIAIDVPELPGTASLKISKIAGIDASWFRPGISTLDDMIGVFGKPKFEKQIQKTIKNSYFENGLICNSAAKGRINTIHTDADFNDSILVNGHDIRHGDTVADLTECFGHTQSKSPGFFKLNGIGFRLTDGVVSKIVVMTPE